MYKKVNDDELRAIAEEYAEDKTIVFEKYRELFESAGYGFEYELKFEEDPFFGEIPYENAFIEVSIFNPEKNYEERYLPVCSKRVRLFLLKYYRCNDKIFDNSHLSEFSKNLRLFLLKHFQCNDKILYKKQLDICFYLIMWFWGKKTHKKEELYLCSEHISDFFIRCQNPFRCGCHGGIYKNRNFADVILITALMLIIAAAILGVWLLFR